MLLPKSKIETVELMNKEDYLGDLSYDLVSEEYSFKPNEYIEDLKLYPAEFYALKQILISIKKIDQNLISYFLKLH